MVKARGLCDVGEFPSQHLWGMREIGQHGFDVEYFPDQTWLGAPERLGYLVQQAQAAVRATRADLIYSACQNNVWLLARMRRLGLLRSPLVSMVHHPLRGWLQNGALVHGHDKLLFLSRLVEHDVRRRFKPAPDATATVGWGPDLRFTDAIPPEGDAVDVLSAGKANRDFATLAEALRGTPWSATVYCAAADAARIKNPPAKMGKRARAVAEQMNTKTFAAELARHFEQVLHSKLQQPRGYHCPDHGGLRDSR